MDVPWRDLDSEQQAWVWEGDGAWYGVRGYFDWLESKSYKMHMRVLLSKYRSYNACVTCGGARLKSDSLLWRVGSRSEADRVLDPAARFLPVGVGLTRQQLETLPGLTLHDVMCLPLHAAKAFFDDLELPPPYDEATEQLLAEVRTRIGFMVEVGLGYLTLDRQSRTLSGGEVQRINLTTALGTSLVNTLFVLDEPSIGLHPRDIGRLCGVLQRLRDSGNTLLVVEHDPQLILAADRVLDLGPGPGKRGGAIVFNGTLAALKKSRRSVTARYLSGARRIAALTAPLPPADHHLEILGAAEHNLREVDVRLPLQRFVVVCGVSGSGKSTLVETVLHRGMKRLLGQTTDAPGRHRAIRGHERVSDIVLVDQTPIGKTTRSNPASYVGALDPIRKLFAAQPLARERGYTAGTFSFNAGDGRCPACGGNGFEHVEMQFLSDVYLRCPDCDGRRYRAEVLEVQLWPDARNMADVLEMTVDEAVTFFADQPEIVRVLEPLVAVGLGYVALGQPVPTLSGGEAQRLKLAGHLAKTLTSRDAGPMLFLFDEPTTGLHFADIEVLLVAMRRLLEAGHSLLVIEHNLDVIASADWVIELGPEGGDGGGCVVAEATPDELAARGDTHTAVALHAYLQGNTAQQTLPVAQRARPKSEAVIDILHAREHNLRNLNVRIPRDRFTVVTGISGSGKSTLAFDILFAEGQRRYLESLNAYARQFVQPASRPDVDGVRGIPPTVAIEQRTSRGGRKSTVATLTEIYHFLRLLFVKLGTQYCPDCDLPIEAQEPAEVFARILRQHAGKSVLLCAPLVVARKGYYTDLAQWAAHKGFAELRVDGVMTPTAAWPRLDRFREHDIDLPVAQLKIASSNEQALRDALARTLEFGHGMVRVVSARAEQLYSTQRSCPGCNRSFAEPDPRLFSFNSRHGWCPTCFGTGEKLKGFDAEQSGEEIWWNDWYEGEAAACPACSGERLRPEARAVRFRDRSITELTALSVQEAGLYLDGLKLQAREAEIAADLVAEARHRLAFLDNVGLGYLALSRAAPTLSGGEAQRIRLAAQLGSNLRGVCYILDEPTIGLHPRDNDLLLNTLKQLQARGNTVVVVEHDESTIRAAQHLIDLGPRAGKEGGELVAQGNLAALKKAKRSLTGRMLAKPLQHPFMPRRETSVDKRRTADGMLEIQGATRNNLRRLNVRIPLQRLVCVTGVSGSGKSTLVRSVVSDNLAGRVGRRGRKGAFQGCREITGYEAIARVLEVDQTPIGKTPRSCPATYIGFWDAIRKLFALTTEARLRGYTASRFSFNVKGGRCDECEGQGSKKIEMSFLPDVVVPCEVCRGARFNRETLAVTYRGKSIGQVLAMSVDEAVDFFAVHPAVHHALTLLQDVGLGYLTLGQQSPTLSGGEAQRIKLVTELAKAKPQMKEETRKGRGRVTGNATLFVLDEPTIGLHMADVEKLIRVLHRLVDAGNSVLLIEHNLDVIAEADWVIDLGPEGGTGGGEVIAQGPPESIADHPRSHTARFLRPLLV